MKNIQILVAKEGWVFVGDASREGDFVVLRNTLNIRRWGTTKGLGELVKGPTANTILDEVGVVRVHVYNIMHTIEMNVSAWAPWLAAVTFTPAQTHGENVKIVLCERRWVYFGRVTRECDVLAIRDARNVRNWKDAAIWQLARGKSANCMLDDYGLVRVGALSTIAEIDCDAAACSSLFSGEL
jgi:hypothetical protein